MKNVEILKAIKAVYIIPYYKNLIYKAIPVELVLRFDITNKKGYFKATGYSDDINLEILSLIQHIINKPGIRSVRTDSVFVNFYTIRIYEFIKKLDAMGFKQVSIKNYMRTIKADDYYADKVVNPVKKSTNFAHFLVEFMGNKAALSFNHKKCQTVFRTSNQNAFVVFKQQLEQESVDYIIKQGFRRYKLIIDNVDIDRFTNFLKFFKKYVAINRINDYFNF